MKEVERRPLVIALAALVIGVTALSYPANLLFLIPLAYAVRSMHGRLLASTLLVIGLLASHPFEIPNPLQSSVSLNGTVSSRPKPARFGGETCLVATEFGPVRVLYDGSPNLRRGDLIGARGDFDPGEDGPVKRPMFLKAFRVERLREGPAILAWSEGWFDRFSSFTHRALPADKADLADTLVFSSADQLPQETKADFRAAGGLQVITSAGLHVLLVAFAVQAGLGLLPVPHWIQLGLLAAILFLFVILSGFQTSTIRASLFALIIRGAYLFRREPDVLSAVSAAGLVLLLFDPNEVEQLGFQLTMVVAFAFALFKGAPTKVAKTTMEHLATNFSRSLRMVVIATAATAPILAQTEHAFVGQSLFASLLSSIALAPTLVLSVALFSTSFLSSSVACWGLTTLVAPLLSWIESVMAFLARLPFLRVEIPYFSGYWLVLIYGCVLAIWRPVVRRA